MAESAAASSSLNITLHPLVVINISDHFTRVKANPAATGAQSSGRVLGAVLGEQVGRHVELANSLEFKIASWGGPDGAPVIDLEYLKTRLEQYKKTFPKYDMLGWYSTAAGVQPGDFKVQEQLADIAENLLYLVLEPNAPPGSRDLPITIFDTEVTVVNETPTPRFVQVSYSVDSIESERIAVDHVAHILPSGDSNSSSALAQHLGGQYTAISMLAERVQLIQQYLKAVSDGQVPADHAMLRQIKSLCSRLPALDTPKFRAEFLQDHNNTLLITYLGMITKNTGLTHEVVDKFNLAVDKHSRRRGVF